ncbi:MAG: hypothetical protein R3343_01165 [Nitriliruptorales bacterium]|nr:hypothetical protein [Nitriliruptorales bacterium]
MTVSTIIDDHPANSGARSSLGGPRSWRLEIAAGLIGALVGLAVVLILLG